MHTRSTPGNKGRLIGQKPPSTLKEIWSLRIRLQLAGGTRDLAMFNLGLDSKLVLLGWPWSNLRAPLDAQPLPDPARKPSQ